MVVRKKQKRRGSREKIEEKDGDDRSSVIPGGWPLFPRVVGGRGAIDTGHFDHRGPDCSVVLV